MIMYVEILISVNPYESKELNLLELKANLAAVSRVIESFL